METEIKDGNLVISIPLTKGYISATGKSLVLASTHGNLPTALKVDGKSLVVSVNAYVSNK